MPSLEVIKKAELVLFGILVALLIGEGFLRWIDYRYSPLRIKTIETSHEWRFYHAFEDKDFVYDPILYGVLEREFRLLTLKATGGTKSQPLKTQDPSGYLKRFQYVRRLGRKRRRMAQIFAGHAKQTN